MLPVSNDRYRKSAAPDNLPGIIVVLTLPGDIKMIDVSRGVAVGQLLVPGYGFRVLVDGFQTIAAGKRIDPAGPDSAHPLPACRV